MIRKAVIWFILSPSLVLASFVETEFENWDPISFITNHPSQPAVQPGLSFGSASLLSSGGNDGAYYGGTNVANYGEIAWSGGIKSDYLYDPQTSGAITRVGFTVEGIQFSTEVEFAYVALVLEQAGELFFNRALSSFNRPFIWGQGWQRLYGDSRGLRGLRDVDFFNSPEEFIAERDSRQYSRHRRLNIPDFSTSGAPMRFGVVVGTYSRDPGLHSQAFGFDNVSVSPLATPLPGSAFLFISGLVTLFARRHLRS